MLSIKFKKDIKKQLKSVYNIDCTAIYPNYYDDDSMTFNIEATKDNEVLSLRMQVELQKKGNKITQFYIYSDYLNSSLSRLNKNLSHQLYFEGFSSAVNDINDYFKSKFYIQISNCVFESVSRVNLLKGVHYYKNDKAYVNDIQLWPNFYEIYVPGSKFKSFIKIYLMYGDNIFSIDVLNKISRENREVKTFELPFDSYTDATLLVTKLLYLYLFDFDFKHLYLFDDIDVNNEDCVNEILSMLSV